jgi:hypothetical protein
MLIILKNCVKIFLKTINQDFVVEFGYVQLPAALIPQHKVYCTAGCISKLFFFLPITNPNKATSGQQ